jgi:hypothetical protein
MLLIGLPLICVLTFQLVKDMAVYEMGVAMTPAAQMLEKAAVEETKITQLKGELAAIEGKREDREHKLAELAAKQAKAKSELEESLKRNDFSRQDAISLTDYQKKELSDVESRQATMIQQFNADSEQLTKAIADLRARREIEVGRATKWNAEEARLENEYKAKLAEYNNQEAAYEKAKSDYDHASFIKRPFMKEPVSPGVPPDREANTVLKPTAVAEIDAQIKSKEDELLSVNNKRRERVAQVEADAHRLREEFDHRSTTKREESDRKREELSAGLAALAKEEKAEHDQIDQEFAAVVQKVDSIRAQIDACQKTAEGYYEAREASIRKTQVHRIATTVEIVRGLIKGERPVSIKTTAKERGDLLTDQISMVRIWVYPVLAFIVAFLPTLMVEIGFSTVFQPEPERPAHRLGFLGRRMHWLYTRAGRLKILRAERMAREATGAIALRDTELAETKAAVDRALFEKDAELQNAREAASAAAARHLEQLKKQQAEHTDQLKAREEEWVAKLAGMADSLNRTVVEKDALKDMQRSEVERQIQVRQNAWSDRITQLRQELDDQRAAHETERTTMMHEHHRKLMEVTEESKAQVVQARRQMADAELAAVEASARLAHDLKEAQHARDEAEAQLKQQADALTLKLNHAQEDAARQIEKAGREEKHRLDRQQLEYEKKLRQRDEDFEHRLNQREQELSLSFEARLGEEKSRFEQAARVREAELERQLEARAREVGARWNQDIQQRDETAHFRLKQREQQLQSQAEVRLKDALTQAEDQLRRREEELERQLEVKEREAETRLKQELQQKDIAFQAILKQREQELAVRANAREAELQSQFDTDMRVRDEEWERQAQTRVRATESRLGLEAKQKEEVAQSAARQREQELVAQLNAKAEARFLAAQAQWETESQKMTLAAIEPLKSLLARAESERDEARQDASESGRKLQSLEKKLNEASSFLNGWRNGKSLVEVS